MLVKGSRLRTLDSIADLIDSQPSRKVLHDDGQSLVDAEYVISKLTVQDDVVFDPLMGELNRLEFGCEPETDTDWDEIATIRLSGKHLINVLWHHLSSREIS
jgi:hypothetical protein